MLCKELYFCAKKNTHKKWSDSFHSGALVSPYDLPRVRSQELPTASAPNLLSSGTQIPSLFSTPISNGNSICSANLTNLK